ncbi:MAG TPA: hypothetical protein VEY92_03325 [Pseudoxanthomonas sp.]|nr:hypothetical protein [Pseudoxanthomonas sp.]
MTRACEQRQSEIAVYRCRHDAQRTTAIGRRDRIEADASPVGAGAEHIVVRYR